ncbi:MAG: molybdopterin-dependent oxidoreductase [Blastocatellia bacterium]|nr:molybdopterin-dependent oxidoreductase [Blastocatellia bacterium]
MKHLIFWLCLLCCATGTVFQPSLSFAQAKPPAATPAEKPLLTIEGNGIKPVTLTAASLAGFKRQTVKVSDHGTPAEFEGVLLYDILKQAGAPLGESFRGKNAAVFVAIEAMDGYRTVFALPELDPMFTDRTIIMADKRDGKSLSEKEGPLRIVVPDEKRAARWVRQVTKIRILNLTAL